ncbi:MAG: energy-coupling factor transporter transmembrane component T [Peptostreptococcaceae bacterium]
MLKDITIGQYYPAKSIIHSLDARVKLIATFIFMTSIFIVDNFSHYLLVLIFLVSVIKSSNIPSKFIFKGLKPLRFIILFTFIINVFFIPGETIWSFGFLSVTKEGLSQATFMSVRLLFLVIGTSILTLTTSPMDLTDGIEKLFEKFKKIGVPVHELAMMMTIALRFIPTLLDETDKIMKAQMSRGADLESKNLMERAKSLIPILVPLFINAFKRADELSVAMEARCYRGGLNRTKMKISVITKEDKISFGILFIYLAIILFMRFYI